MSVINNSSDEVFHLYQQVFHVALTEGSISKHTFAILIVLILIYLNAIMSYTLCSKHIFKVTPRYILFNHMLINDSIQLFVTSLLYVLGVAYVQLEMTACAFIVSLSVTTFYNSPLNLALMSLERYVAIRVPLRHTEIVTQTRTCAAIGMIWLIGLMFFIIDLLYVVLMDPKFLTSQIFCTKERVFIRQWQVDLFWGFNIFFFVSMSMIILFTYVRIFVTARSMSANKESAVKAHKTVLLHLIQLGLCLISLFYSIIEQATATSNIPTSLYHDLRYLTYVLLVLLPRCLSPLIYGLRDNAIRPLFMYYFRCGTGKHSPTVNVH